ncbi:hypothetical protein HMPREF9598_01992 [Cutibacterium acnes HL050PA1]|nr:hypothetical protein HMPREF9575_01592 [Cutibacterium acnes HL110PA1]EFS69992.1 hypothetical protein HMPREF9616_00149 [Cutibacterium acnes HL007PA1]EFS81287.1 hypothetical protein HMPREF9598_01992 [Cutibacterium acnes HL050PA1]EFS85624.1 hypothetical protein HMPREF9600_00077 [Cutibacterium acnes HL050PA3]EFT05740.1 hypothetical protein HMPREF9614_00615 [Cutibacterium acnes HL002PA2]EFT79389.1 hypothetical protein HMPREF9601_00331 [Cutibacterium acnes HL030PA1]EGF04092.1 hypothetical protein
MGEIDHTWVSVILDFRVCGGAQWEGEQHKPHHQATCSSDR